MSAAEGWGLVFMFGLGAVLIAGLNLGHIAIKQPDVNRDSRAILQFGIGARIRVQIPGEEPVGYYIRISEQAYNALEINGSWVRIGPAGATLPVIVEQTP